VTKHPGEILLDLSADSVELTRAVCDIPSVSGSETALADAIERAIRRCDHLLVTREADTIVARTNLGRPERIVIAGHIDTVPVNANLPCRFESEDGVEYLWGRGTVDMKSGLAVQLKLAAELVNPRYDITWIWYDHEEVDAALNGLNKLRASHPELLEADFAILGEPSNGLIEGGCNGNIRVELRTFGRRAHSARNWMGENAIQKAAPILATLASYQAREVEVDGLLYRESLSAVGIDGGVAGNVIPDECMVHINYRFAPDQSEAEAAEYLRGLFPEADDFRIVDSSGGARPGLDAPLAQELLVHVGEPPQPKYGWTDVARFAALGIPAVNYGPGDASLAHADNERVAVAQIRDVELGLRNWLTQATRTP
jgi:succinyl-diaminopimelate desuccinylase